MARTRPTATRDFRLDFAPMRTRRRHVNLSQGDLAAAVGVHLQTVSRTENGLSEPSLRQMVGYSRALGIPIHLLFTVQDTSDAGT